MEWEVGKIVPSAYTGRAEGAISYLRIWGPSFTWLISSVTSCVLHPRCWRDFIVFRCRRSVFGPSGDAVATSCISCRHLRET